MVRIEVFKSKQIHYVFQSDERGASSSSMLMRIVDAVCCRDDFCRRCVESLGADKSKEKPSMENKETQHPVVSQPIAKLESTSSVGAVRMGSASCSSTSGSRFGSVSGYHSGSARSAQNSPVFHFSPREKKDSESGSAFSRMDSSSSSVPDSPASFGKRCHTPFIDMNLPIEFCPLTINQGVQPRAQQTSALPPIAPPRASTKSIKRRLPSESEISIDDLNPDIYEDDVSKESATDEQRQTVFGLGKLRCEVKYSLDERLLVVLVQEAESLPPPAVSNKQEVLHSNPYVRVCLLPGGKDARQTSVQRKTQNPVWNESFEFSLSFSELQSRSVELTVKDFDKFSRHCVIGKVTVKLDHHSIVKGVSTWRALQPSTQVRCFLKLRPSFGKSIRSWNFHVFVLLQENHDIGQLLLSLNYLPAAGRLNCDVIKARQLMRTDLDSTLGQCLLFSSLYSQVTLSVFLTPSVTSAT